MNARALVLLAVTTLVLPLLSWWSNIGGLERLFTDDAPPPGQSLYLGSRLAGLIAFALIGWQFVLGLSTRFGSGGSAAGRLGRRAHAMLGAACVALAWMHALLFVGAATLRQEHPATALLLPSLRDHYHTMITLGLVAAVALTLAALVRLLRHAALRRTLHRIAYLAPGLALVHAVSIGTETRDPALVAFYALLGAAWVVSLWLAFAPRLRSVVRVG